MSQSDSQGARAPIHPDTMAGGIFCCRIMTSNLTDK